MAAKPKGAKGKGAKEAKASQSLWEMCQEFEVESEMMETRPVRCKKEQSGVVTKPQFARYLEDYLKKELAFTGAPPRGPSLVRLQAYREVFECLVDKFTTYKPLLASIKLEYDRFIDNQEKKIRELHPLQTKLLSTKEGYEKKIIALKENDKKQDDKEKQRGRQLQKEIDRLKERGTSYKLQIEKLKEEVADLYEKYRFEADARKLLIADYNELKISGQNDDQQDEEVVIEKEDPVILKLKLVRAKEELHIAKKHLNEVMADYGGDVVPKEEYELIESSYRKAESELDTKKAQCASAIEEYNLLLIMYKELERRGKSMEELERIKQSATPRSREVGRDK
ncbi:PREDICTED: translin-associated factor X-interacting protein 1-like [Amphimedon queenslandica]|uniref:Translin-associated factor X-interacting protein 1 N-terminal domain-containing protein n=1 Tax=Amphimedon queenslandica TaxID=400682 RepID=A0A1X7VEL0_AMPQE|nr:PREDICTED: translin-associated factor X-interacting protein 1-like [Amphimedon queenslandica]|eukprot:XP_003384392.2 PREDICTED: translin-associated factor X-interacting protein 1-like [Amphimedon queenslandica]